MHSPGIDPHYGLEIWRQSREETHNWLPNGLSTAIFLHERFGARFRTPAPSSTWLGWGSLSAVGAVSEVYGEVSLEFFEDAVEAQAAPSAFGRVRRI